MLSVVAIVLITMGLLEYVRRATLSGIIDSLSIAVSTGNSAMGIFETMNNDIGQIQFAVYAIVVLMSVLVGLIATRLALGPVRDSLITQRRFIANVAHELRTPLAILKTQNEVSRFGVTPGSDIAETLEQNVLEIDHITEILNNLLLFSRVDTVESIVFDKVDTEKSIEAVISRLKQFSEKKGVSVHLEKTGAPNVYGNDTGLEQAFFNLVKNAINYTPRGGKVTITCVSISEQEVTFRVADTGIGINKSELPHIFEPFFRTNSVQHMNQGTGLGLALVFEIIKLHNGRISVHSVEGTGTQFDISLPRDKNVSIQNPETLEAQVVYDFSIQK